MDNKVGADPMAGHLLMGETRSLPSLSCFYLGADPIDGRCKVVKQQIEQTVQVAL